MSEGTRRGRGGRSRQGQRGRGRSIPTGLRPVAEATRISIQDVLLDFQKSDDTVYTFPAELSNHDRAVVHSECRKYGFNSKSHGKGSKRRLTLTKPSASGDHSTAHDIEFSSESAKIVQDYFKRFPEQTEVFELANAEGGLKGQKSKRQKKGKFSDIASSLSTEQVAKKEAAWKQRIRAPQHAAINASRAALPIAKSRDAILDAVQNNQVVLIAGETGCGKTTQVPQYLLEDSWGSGKGCRILCTQPRRISAVTISERVAVERGETIGDNVGYTIRLESSGGPHCSLMFMTCGVLLRQLTQGDQLDDVTHIVMDEIHERDRFADFTLILLKELLVKKPSLRLILMSATLHADLFSGYFNNCPTITVEGFTHPVHDVYLEEILPLIGFRPQGNFREDVEDAFSPTILIKAEKKQLDDAIFQAFVSNTAAPLEELIQALEHHSQDPAYLNYQHSQTGGTALMVMAGKGCLHHVISLLSMGADASLKASNGMTAVDWASRFGHADIEEHLREHISAMEESKIATESAKLLSRYQAVTDAEEVDLLLIEKLLMFVCFGAAQQDSGSAALGAALVFLPGWEAIMRLKEILEANPAFNAGKCAILPLHSMVPAAEQRKVFARPPAGQHKIVLATNIAETAVTIDDITVVVNSGRMKEKSYDCYTEVSTLMATWVSKASEKQRRGRAGRCQPGVCFHLYTKQRSEALQDFQAAELQRTPLDELCLQAKLMDLNNGRSIRLAEFLGKAVEPPPAASIKGAVRLLEEMGALEPKTERLTLLGRNLAALPLPPRLGKMLLFGILFNVLDTLLTVACCISYRTPWMVHSNPTARTQAEKAKAQFATEAGGLSDHLALAKAYEKWAIARANGSEHRFAASRHLNNATMNIIHGTRDQLLNELQAQGLLSNVREASKNVHRLGLVRSVLAASLYPQFAQVIQTHQGQQRLLISSKEKVRIHPSSVNSSMKALGKGTSHKTCRVVFFDEKTRLESNLYAMQTTLCNPHIVLLIAGSLKVIEPEPESDWDEDEEYEEESNGEHSLVLIDGWLRVRVKTRHLEAIASLRRRLAQCLAAKVHRPRAELMQAHRDLLIAVGKVLTKEWEDSGLDHAQKWNKSGTQDPSGQGGRPTHEGPPGLGKPWSVPPGWDSRLHEEHSQGGRGRGRGRGSQNLTSHHHEQRHSHGASGVFDQGSKRRPAQSADNLNWQQRASFGQDPAQPAKPNNKRRPSSGRARAGNFPAAVL